MKEFIELINIMKTLRNPVKGCPWDLKQNPQSLKEYILEESYELLEAINNNDPEEIKEELGDLLLQIIFISRIFQEKGEFDIRDVLKEINKKLINRHPHVFGDLKVKNAQEVKDNWEKIKKKEKKKKSIISDYSEQTPALQNAKRISEQASSVGFDWKDAKLAFEKVEEEIKELKQELNESNKEKIEEEIGDLLFAIANVSRLLKINPEFALKKTNKKFKKRFRFIEETLESQDKKIEETELEEMEELWQKSKS